MEVVDALCRRRARVLGLWLWAARGVGPCVGMGMQGDGRLCVRWLVFFMAACWLAEDVAA